MDKDDLVNVGVGVWFGVGTGILTGLLLNPGPNGKRGMQGTPGIQGDMGDLGQKGEKGNVGKTGYQGEKGDEGDQGDKGEKGNIGEKGVVGSDGEKGEVGEKGNPGDHGEKGSSGDVGHQGPIGLAGSQGPSGPRGPAGIQGQQGPVGPHGPQGERGLKGDRGLTGSRGPIGQTGPAGSSIGFTGMHLNPSKRSMSELKPGLIVESTGEMSGEITANEAYPYLDLAKSFQSKSVYGVVGIPQDNRLIINSLGQGAIFVTSEGGIINNGDYITSSNILGYGIRQESDMLHNYTVAKATIACDFTGNSSFWIDNDGNVLKFENENKELFKEVYPKLAKGGLLSSKYIEDIAQKYNIRASSTNQKKLLIKSMVMKGRFRAQLIACTYHCG